MKVTLFFLYFFFLKNSKTAKFEHRADLKIGDLPRDQRILFYLVKHMSKKKIELCETAVSILRRKQTIDRSVMPSSHVHKWSSHEQQCDH